MKNYYKLVIDKTAKPMGRVNDTFSIYDREVKMFDTIDEAEDYLKDQYFYCKTKRKMYIDLENGESVQSGWIYSFKSEPYSYDDVHHFEQHWVILYAIASEPAMFKPHF